ncbi:MAG: SCP2 sterol-binding domain-containing protein [Thermodesulfobacteriota bacterium]
MARNLTLRQMLEGMTLGFNAEAAGDLEAVIQFQVTGPEIGSYYLHIRAGDCTFHRGEHRAPNLTIETPSDVWLKISRGELSGQEALLGGQYRVEGDGNLLVRMSELFSGADQIPAPPGQRPPGPLPWSGMVWMTVVFLPWMVFWIFFETSGPWVSVLIPLVFTLLLVAYRLHYGGLTLLEGGTLVFFLLAGLLSLISPLGFQRWGSPVSSASLGGLWFGSLLFSALPLCGEYSKWGYQPRLWRTTLFIHPNAVISLMWGWQFQAAALLGLAACLVAEYRGPLTAARYLLLVPAFIFTSVYQKGSPDRRLEDIDGALRRLRIRAGAGLAFTLGVVIVSILVLT